MTAGEALIKISESIIWGLEILDKLKDILSNEEKRHDYPITKIKLLKEEGKINFNFYWVKLFLKFQLNGDYRPLVGGESIQFEHPLIWGRYVLKNGIEEEEPIVEDSKIRPSAGGIGLELKYGELFYSLDRIDHCLRIIDKIIYTCLPVSMVKIENLELD